MTTTGRPRTALRKSLGWYFEAAGAAAWAAARRRRFSSSIAAVAASGKIAGWRRAKRVANETPHLMATGEKMVKNVFQGKMVTLQILQIQIQMEMECQMDGKCCMV